MIRFFTHIKIWIVCCLCLIWPAIAFGSAYTDYEQARKLYLAAAAARAAYSDRIGGLTFEALEDFGYEIQSFEQIGKKADARFLLAKTTFNGQPLYLVALAGTETIKDLQVDLNYNKVPYGGHTYEEIDSYASLPNLPETEPKVHKGFHEYVQNALTVEKADADEHHRQRLADVLLANREIKVLFVGHSLGGAAATLGGTRFLSMGVNPEQIEVITFGAPAVGNKAFCELFENKLNLTRIVMGRDAIPNALQKVAGGYQQFGKKVSWQQSTTNHLYAHEISGYMDTAIKQYYDARLRAIAQNAISPLPAEKPPYAVYIAPITFSGSNDLTCDHSYMKEALLDEYRHSLPSFIIDNTAGTHSPTSLLEKARKANSSFLITPTVEIHKLKNKRYGYYIGLQQTVYNVHDGRMVAAACYSSTNSQLTPLEAFMHTAKTMSGENKDWLTSAKPDINNNSQGGAI